MLREATYPPAAVNVLDVSSESMAAFQVFLYGRFWVFTEAHEHNLESRNSVQQHSERQEQRRPAVEDVRNFILSCDSLKL